MFNFKSTTVFDLVREADDDNATAAGTDAAAGTDDAGGDDAPAPGEEDFGKDEDYDIDTSISGDDDAGGEGDAGDTDNVDNTDDTSGSTSNSYGGDIGGESDEEPVKKNTDIFAALTKEEQAIKIEELKRLYNEMYISLDDMLGKVNDINPDEDTLVPLTKVTSAMYSLKVSLAKYIESIFSFKSFIENDITYNRYLTIVKSITTILDTITKEVEEKLQKEDNK